MHHYTFEKFVGSTAIGLALILLAAPMAKSAETPSGPATIKQESAEIIGRKVRIGDNQDGSLLFKADTSGQYIKAPLVKTDVVMDIAGPIIRTRLSQTFENTSDQWVEGIYVFPLPENAAVDHLRMVIGGRLIEGQIKEKKQAKKIYEQAKSEGKKASLVEQERPNLFTASVANIGPHEKVAIQIEYQDKASIKSGVFSTRFPMTVAPRYSPPVKPVKIASNGNGPMMVLMDPVLDRKRITPPLMNPKDEPTEYLRLPVTMTVNLDAGFPLTDVQSPYHNVTINNIDADSAQIRFKDGPVPANKDFKLEWQAQPSDTPYSAFFKQTVGEDTYLLSMLTPTKPITPQIQTHARESIFVVDTSGSMGGKSIEQARASLHLALDHLEDKDTFNIIRFSSDHSMLFTTPQTASIDNVKRARRFVDALQADGGTEMAPALAEALIVHDASNERVRQILFITDGAIGNEQMLFAMIKDNLKNSRLFPVGIGSAPNSFFMSRAAKFGRGTFVQIGNLTEVKDRMGTLFASLDNPVLTGLHSNVQDKGASFPQHFPDLYEGDPIISVAKINSDTLPNNMKLNGKLAGKNWSSEHTLENITQANGVSVLWAREKIASLEESRFDRDTAANIDAEILQTALDHHIVSRLTSLVAVDITPSRAMNDDLFSKQVPTQLPAGWDFGKLAANSAAPLPKPVSSTPDATNAPQQNLPLPGTASPHVLMTVFGFLLMLFGMMAFRFRNLLPGRS